MELALLLHISPAEARAITGSELAALGRVLARNERRRR